jgi:hypothetical protein
MSTLAEIETAADALPAAEKQQLMLFLASRLQAEGAIFPENTAPVREAMGDWMAEDEAAMRRFHPAAWMI